MRKGFVEIMRSMQLVKCASILLALLGFLFSGSSILLAQTDKKAIACEECKPGIALPNEKCRVDLSEDPDLEELLKWNEAEKWAWKEICEGRIADFNGWRRARKLNPRNPKTERLDPRNLEDDEKWAKGRRTLNQRFLKTILLHEPFRSAIPHQGVRINGAYFRKGTNLEEASIGWPLMLERSFFKSRVDLERFRTSRLVSFEGSKFLRTLDMGSAKIGGDLLMRTAIFRKVDLRRAEIDGLLDMRGSKFRGWLVMNSVKIDKNLYMRNAEFRDVVLREAKVGGHFDMNGSEIGGFLSIYSASIGRNLLMRNAKFGDIVFLNQAQLDGGLSMIGSTFENKLDLSSATIGGHIEMDESIFNGKLDMASVSVGTNMNARGVTLNELDLTESNVKGAFRLGALPEKKINWKGETPKLGLRNASVGTLHDTEDAWPEHLELDGFTYKRFAADGKEAPVKRANYWFIKWLEKDKTYSPQPYRHLASVFRDSGLSDMADDILYANRERERAQPDTSLARWTILTLFKITIGYGYGSRVFLGLYWALLNVIVGTIMLRISKDCYEEKWGVRIKKLGFWYSVDMLVPFIHLREQHYTDVNLDGWVRYYFYVHQLAGYILIYIAFGDLPAFTKLLLG